MNRIKGPPSAEAAGARYGFGALLRDGPPRARTVAAQRGHRRKGMLASTFRLFARLR